MGAKLLTTMSQVMCPHGGQATLITGNLRVKAGSAAVLLENDVHVVAGCAFTIGPKYSPCVRIEWTAGASSSKVAGVKPLTQASVGKCLGAEGAVQGLALKVSTQLKASAT